MVEVRAPAEILSTLDGDASVDAMPFMPEMLQHAGRRFTVSSRVEKICDTVSESPQEPEDAATRSCSTTCGARARPTGVARPGAGSIGRRSGFGGSTPQARTTAARAVMIAPMPSRDSNSWRAEATVAAHGADGTSVETYRCQATEALRASEPLRSYDLRQYLRELTSGNVGVLRLLRVAWRGISTAVRRRLRLIGRLPLRHQEGPVPPKNELNLQSGDLVEVRSPDEIAPSIDETGRTRGLWFDWEMIPYCGGRYRVKDRVERLIDERTGEMIEISSDCLILDGVVCGGECSTGRWLCPRAIYPYWREAWLRRVDAEPSPSGR